MRAGAIGKEVVRMPVWSSVHHKAFSDSEALARHTAEWLIGIAASRSRVLSLCLSGGSTPRRLYELLAARPYRDAFPWSRAHWFWSDERFVAHDDASSNYGMASRAMLSHTPVPSANIHSIPTTGVTAEAAADAYERELKAFYGSDHLDETRPLFDVVLLGLGEDGHTASLFPGSAALDEKMRWATTAEGPNLKPRITLTYPVLESARDTAFLITGTEKRTALNQLLHGDSSLPAGRLRPVGNVWLFADAAAAGGIVL